MRRLQMKSPKLSPFHKTGKSINICTGHHHVFFFSTCDTTTKLYLVFDKTLRENGNLFSHFFFLIASKVFFFLDYGMQCKTIYTTLFSDMVLSAHLEHFKQCTPRCSLCRNGQGQHYFQQK